MDKNETIDKLKSLYHLDIDAIHSYDKALEKIDDESIRSNLIQFRKDHERHVRDYATLFLDLGEEPPEYSRDIKGIFLEGLTALQSMTGTEGALKGVQQGEKVTNRKYADAVSWDVSPDIQSIIERNYSDEKHHLRYVNQVLENRVWEREAARR
ncbi:MAG: ferritin-like domain-containing protein [Candidatus Latescibacterota bacterium]